MKQAARSAAGPTSIIRYHDINQIRAWDYRLGREKNQRNAPSDDAEAERDIICLRRDPGAHRGKI